MSFKKKITSDYIDGKMNTIIHHDCIETMRKIPNNYFDLILTDIPYGKCDIVNNGIWDRNPKMQHIHKADKETFNLDDFLSEAQRICKGSFYIFCGAEQISPIKEGLSKNNTTRLLIWEKTNPMPINGEYVFLSGIEACVWAKKKGATFNALHRNTVFRYPLAQDGTAHPTTKPIRLFEEFIKISTNEGDKIFDPCMGSGTTAIASKALNREWCGCEINKDYVDIAETRLKKVQGSLLI